MRQKAKGLLYFWLLFYNEKHRFPPIDVQVDSDFGLQYETSYGPFTKRTLQVVLPLYMKDERSGLEKKFTRDLYTRLKATVTDAGPIIVNRKRRVVFGTVPGLRDLEDHLVSEQTSMSPEEYRALLRYYKLAFDLAEHLRALREAHELEPVVRSVEEQIRALTMAQASQNNSGQAQQRATDMQRVHTALTANRIRPEEGFVDVTFGCNYALYHEDLRPKLYFDSECAVDSESLQWMRRVQKELEADALPIRKRIGEVQAELQSVLEGRMTQGAYIRMRNLGEQLENLRASLRGRIEQATETQERILREWLAEEERRLPNSQRNFALSAGL